MGRRWVAASKPLSVSNEATAALLKSTAANFADGLRRRRSACSRAVRGLAVAGDEIEFRQQQPIGECHLPDRLVMLAAGSAPVDSIDQRDDAGNPEQSIECRFGEERLQHRRRLGEAGSFDDDAVERGNAACGAIVIEAVEGCHQVAADGTAKAAVLQHDDRIAGGCKQRMVEPDLTEFVDDDNSVPQLRRLQCGIDEGRLATAEEAGDQRDGDAGGVRCH